MYGWIFRHLPGPLPLRIVFAVALIAAVVMLLFTVVFPWVQEYSPLQGSVTVETSAVGSDGAIDTAMPTGQYSGTR